MSDSMWTGAFWKATAERAIRTFAQAAVAFLGADTIGVLDVDWVQGASVSGLAALLSVLTCIAAGAASPATGPSLGTERPTGGTFGDRPDDVVTLGGEPRG